MTDPQLTQRAEEVISKVHVRCSRPIHPDRDPYGLPVSWQMKDGVCNGIAN
jgi:hypothetical protein